MLSAHLDPRLNDRPAPPRSSPPPGSLPHALRPEDLLRLFSALDNLKHRCLLRLTYAAGLRLGELLNLCLEDIDFTDRRVRIRGGRRRPDRWVGIGSEVWQEFIAYRRVYRVVDLIFQGRTGQRYSPRSVQAVLRRAVALSGVDPATTVHSLRNSFGVHLLERGVPPERVRTLMGLSTNRSIREYARVASG